MWTYINIKINILVTVSLKINVVDFVYHLFLTDDPSPNDEPEFQYYMSEGVYGSFASKLSETLIAAPAVHKVSLKDSLWFKM